MAAYINIFLGTIPSMCAGILATFAITLIFKTSYTTNFAQGVISAVGAYVAMELCMKNGLPLWATTLIAIVVCFVIGVFIDVAIFRTGRNVNTLGKQIITMGLISLFVGLIPFVFSIANAETGYTLTFFPTSAAFVVGGVRFSYNTLLYTGITIAIIAVLFIVLRFSKWGLSVRATASNEIVAGMMGVNTKIITAISWGIAGALGAVAAIIYVGNISLSNGLVMTTTQINAFLAGILGGFATFYGPIVGAVIIYLLNAVVGCITVVVPELSMWKSAIVYIIVMLLVLLRPQGLFGKRTVKKV